MALPDRCIVGLGNPGPRYAGTRHNAGREAVGILGERWDVSFADRKIALLGETMRRIGEGRERILLMLPETFMNLSGRAVEPLFKYGFDAGDLIVVTDDIFLPTGRIRVRPSGGTGGHHGLESIARTASTEDFPRIRIGVGPVPDGLDWAEYVLKRPSPPEREAMDKALQAAAEAVEMILDEGMEEAMNRFNGREIGR